MKVFVKGKDEVLNYLETEAKARTGGQEGEYLLLGDENGNLYAFIAGHCFSGQVSINLKETPLEVTKFALNNGILVNIKE